MLECIYCLGDKLLDIFPILISILAIGIAFYSWMTNSEPVIVFAWDSDNQSYYIKNVGKGPALNIIVVYVNDTEINKDWKNPVRCYSLEPNGVIQIDWGLKIEEHGNKGIERPLFSKSHDKGDPNGYLNGVTKLAAVYSSANFFIKQAYTSKFEDEITKIQTGMRIKWTGDKIFRIWDLKQRSIARK